MVFEFNIQDFLSDKKVIATLIGGLITFLIAIISSIISLITNYKHRRLMREVEFLKSELQKETISYQIFRAEQTKRRFEKLILLYESLIDLMDFQKNKLASDYGLFADYNNIMTECNNLLITALTNFRKSRLYLTKDLKNSIHELLQNCENTTDNYIIRQSNEENFVEFTNRLKDSVAKFEPLLEDLENRIKLNLDESNKNRW